MVTGYKDIYFDPRMGRYGHGRWRSRVTGRIVKTPEESRLQLSAIRAEVANKAHQYFSERFPEVDRYASDVIRNMADVYASADRINEDLMQASGAIEEEAENINAFIVNNLSTARGMAKEAGALLWEPEVQRLIVSPLGHTIASDIAFAVIGGEASAIKGLAATEVLARQASLGVNQEAYYAISGLTYSLADRIFRLGKFLSESAAVGFLVSGASGSAVTFAFEESIAGYEALIGSLATSEGVMDLISDAVNITRDSIIQEYVRQIRLKMGSQNVRSIGGNVNAPITNTGTLARSIGEIERHPDAARPRDLYGGAGSAIIATIGIRDPGTKTASHQQTGVYGEVLSKARSSSPPRHSVSAAGWFHKDGQIRKRFEAWGTKRGLSNQQIEMVMAKVFQHGTYGRAWMTQIAAQISPANIEFVGEAMKKEIDSLIV